MARSAPAVAALVVLALTGSRMLTAACEIACYFAAPVPHTGHSISATPAIGHGCHEFAPPTDHPVRMSPSPHAACAHQEAPEPFVVATKSADKSDTLIVKLADASVMTPLDSAGVETLLRGHAPPGPRPARVVPLRI